MASKRDLKKDVNFLMEEVLGTCMMHYHLKKDKQESQQKINEIMDEIVDFRNDIMYKINHPEEELKGKTLKGWYSDLLNEMIEKTDEAFEKLGSLHNE